MQLKDILRPGNCTLLRASTKREALKELVGLAGYDSAGKKGEEILGLALEREELASSIVSAGVAFPHAITEGEETTTVAVGVSREGVLWDTPDRSVHVIVLLVGSRLNHLAVLSELASALRAPEVVDAVRSAARPQEIYELLVSETPSRPDTRMGQALVRHAVLLAGALPNPALVIHGHPLERPEEVLAEITGGPPAVMILSRVPASLTAPGNVQLIALPEKPPDEVLGYLASAGLLPGVEFAISIWAPDGRDALSSLLVTHLTSRQDRLETLLSRVQTSGRDPEVIRRVLRLAADVAVEGREGKPVGALFVVGDSDRVVRHCRQLIVNPFKGYEESQRSILDPSLEETIKEFAKIDGAFVIRDDGVVLSAGTYVAADVEDGDLKPGLGARHAAAAGISRATQAVAIAISESTRKVSVYVKGESLSL